MQETHMCDTTKPPIKTVEILPYLKQKTIYDDYGFQTTACVFNVTRNCLLPWVICQYELVHHHSHSQHYNKENSETMPHRSAYLNKLFGVSVGLIRSPWGQSLYMWPSSSSSTASYRVHPTCFRNCFSSHCGS